MGLSSLMGMLAGFSLATGNGLSYLDSAGTCVACKAKGLDKDSEGKCVCSSCPYYEYSLMGEMFDDKEESDQDPDGGGTVEESGTIHDEPEARAEISESDSGICHTSGLSDG